MHVLFRRRGYQVFAFFAAGRSCHGSLENLLFHMAKILIAASGEPLKIIERALADHDLTFAETMPKAERLLRKETFDLIVCTVLFDESRMLDFLRLAKSRPEWRSIPFACVRFNAPALSHAIAIEAVEIASRALGAAAFVDASAFRVNPERKMREEIERLIR